MSFEIEFMDNAHEGVPLDISATVSFDGEDFYIDAFDVYALNKGSEYLTRGFDITELLSDRIVDGIEDKVYRRASEYVRTNY